jgi:hypothetical protein
MIQDDGCREVTALSGTGPPNHAMDLASRKTVRRGYSAAR